MFSHGCVTHLYPIACFGVLDQNGSLLVVAFLLPFRFYYTEDRVGNEVQQIEIMAHKAYLVVADLTHERPNVYFELGYARGLSKTIITTARDGTPLHFDVKDWTCTFYNDSRVLERHLHERFSFELKRL